VILTNILEVLAIETIEYQAIPHAFNINYSREYLFYLFKL